MRVSGSSSSSTQWASQPATRGIANRTGIMSGGKPVRCHAMPGQHCVSTRGGLCSLRRTRRTHRVVDDGGVKVHVREAAPFRKVRIRQHGRFEGLGRVKDRVTAQQLSHLCWGRRNPRRAWRRRQRARASHSGAAAPSDLAGDALHDGHPRIRPVEDAVAKAHEAFPAGLDALQEGRHALGRADSGQHVVDRVAARVSSMNRMAEQGVRGDQGSSL